MKDDAAAAFYHLGNRQTGNDERAFQIHVQSPVPILFGDFGDAAVGTHAAAVDYDIDAAQITHGFPDKSSHPSGIRYVARPETRFAANLLNHGDGLSTFRLSGRRPGNRGTFLGEHNGDRLAQAGTESCDKRNLSLQFHCLPPLNQPC
jgi:hypothetical protein